MLKLYKLKNWNGMETVFKKENISQMFSLPHKVVFRVVWEKHLTQNCNGNTFIAFKGYMTRDTKSHSTAQSVWTREKMFFNDKK